MRIRRAISSLGEPPFKVLAVILLAVFAVTRLPYFWYSPRVDLSLDSDAYLALADLFRGGKWPQLLARTPGYPLFMLLVRSCVDRLVAVIFVQNLLSFLAALCLAYSVHRLWRPLALPVTIALCGFLGSSQVLIYDISLLTESLYTSTVILVVACLFLGLTLDSAAFLSLGSALMAWAILVRPAGAYLAVIYALVLAFLLWNRFRLRAVLGFMLPFPALLLGLCAYNERTAGQFVITGAAESNLAGATLLFWEPDPRLPERVNKALARLPDTYGKMGITQQELDLVRTSWSPGPLFDVYTKAYNRLVWSSGFGTGHQFGEGDFIQNRKLVRDASIIAIRRHPDLYAKYVWVNLVMFFEGVGYKFDFQSSLEYRATGPIPSEVKADDLVRADGRPARPPQPSARRGSGAGAEDSAVEHALKRLQLGWQSLHGIIFQSIAWAWAYFAVMVLSLVQLVRSGGRHRGAFLLVVLTLVPVGAALVVCLVEEALDRYSYPTQFIYYVSVALSPLLWREGMLGRPSARPVSQGAEHRQAQA